MISTRLRAATLGAVLLGSLVAGCGGGGGGDEPKPTVGEVSDALQDLDVPAEVAPCIADAIQPELSAKVLQALVDGDETVMGTSSEVDATSEAVKSAASDCMAEATSEGS